MIPKLVIINILHEYIILKRRRLSFAKLNYATMQEKFCNKF